MASAKPLVIVESPAKARTIAGYLGDGYMVESSIGHIRDLPRNASDVPPAYKKAAWARLGVDVDHGFRPLYVVSPDKKSQLARLKELLKNANELYLATDEDREGESIAWHLCEVLSPKVPVKRMVFHEITRPAILAAIKNPREVDRRLVDAQEARRILDRLYGYEVSPVLWKKVMPKLSAGRVQSVATRMIVDRERARIRFRKASYWDLEGVFEKVAGDASGLAVPAALVSVDGKRVASGKDFSEIGELTKREAVHLDEAGARTLARALDDAAFTVNSVERKPNRQRPSAPFMTSTLQQEAMRKLRFSSARTMAVAQRLYESGYITYMRTDSTTLSEAAVGSARKQIQAMYGADYLPESPRVYSKKVKNAQEAHEAIRPAGDVFRTPEEVAREVGNDEARLYQLIWMRTIASQMEDSRGESVSVVIGARSSDGRSVELAASGSVILFPGFLRAYVEGSDDPSAELESRDRPLPPLTEGEKLKKRSLDAKGHETQPSARFTEASLIRELEEQGIGRPSTYASIISTILDRGYVWKKGTALVPSWKAFAVVALLEQHFGDLVDYAFTARMEDELDAIASGTEEIVPYLRRFYFGDGASSAGPKSSKGKKQPEEEASSTDRSKERMGGVGLKSLVADRLGDIDARAINSLPIGLDTEGRELLVRVGRYGPYVQRGEDTTSIPEDLCPDELTVEKATELLAAPSGDRELGNDPASGLPVFVRTGRFGAYVQLGEAGASKDKPRTSSLLRSMVPEKLSLEEALQLLSLPRVVGVDPADSKPITAQLGRFGPYISKETDSRSLGREEDVFKVTLEEALALFAQPRVRARKAAAEPIRELGVDNVSGKVITLRQGRFGLYVTDGETNASLRRDDSPEELTTERSQELLQARRERTATMPPKRGAPKKVAKAAPKAKAKATVVKKATQSEEAAPKSKKPAARKPAKKKSAKARSKARPSSAGSAGAGAESTKRARAGGDDAEPRSHNQPAGRPQSLTSRVVRASRRGRASPPKRAGA